VLPCAAKTLENARMVRTAHLFSMAFLTLVFTLLFANSANAQIDHQLIRRMAIFPIATSATTPLSKAEDLNTVLDEAWWQAREEFAQNRRFLVASKQFLIKSDVFQPRRELEPADAIILGKLLDAHALVTLQMIDRRLLMTVYDGGNGLALWKKGVSLHPSIATRDQLPTLAKKLVLDFIASIPYQGFTIIDALIGTAVYEEGDVKLAQVDLGIQSRSQIGDLVQWVRIAGTTAQPLFQGGSKTTVYAEGKIVKLAQGLATVEIQRASSLKDLKEYSLVRVPREAERLATEYTLSENPRTTLTAELVAPEASPMERIAKEKRPLATTLSIIASVATFLLLAF
jgi:hypothetical protein